jgi:putative ABC transport system permease protein
MNYSGLLLALRSISKQKFYAILNIAGFSLGLSLIIFIGLYLFEQFSYDKWYTDHDRIYRVEVDDWAVLGPVYTRLIESSSADIQQTLRVNSNWGNDVIVRVARKKTSLSIPYFVLADSTIFNFFDFSFIEGNPANALNAKDKIVLTRSQAVRLYGKTDILGETIKIRDQYTLIVSGVIEDIRHLHFNLDALGSFELFGDIYSPEYFESKGDWNHNTYVKVYPESNITEIEQAISVSIVDYFDKVAGTSPERKIRLRPAADIYFATDKLHEIAINHGNKSASYAFLLIAVFILFIAVVNFVNLSTAQSSSRARDTGIRRLLGSSRGNLVLQFLSESVLITFLAVFLAIGLVEIFLPYFNYITSSENHFSDIGWFRLGVVLSVGTLIIGILSGIYPAFYLSGFQPINTLKGELTKGRSSTALRRVLIAFQFTISIALISSTIILYQQLNHLNDTDPGFNKEDIVYFKLNAKVYRNWESFRNTLLSHSAIKSVGLSNTIPGQVRWQESMINNGVGFQFTYWPMNPEYFNMLELSMLSGRPFSRDMHADVDVAIIINEQWAWQSGLPFNDYEDLIGYSFENEFRKFKIIGVVSDFNFNSLHESIGPLVIAWRSKSSFMASIKLDKYNTNAAISFIEENWNQLSPDDILSINFLNISLEKLYDNENKMGIIFLSFSCFAIIIACMGLFGMASFMVEKRTREFSIRKVLGASSTGILILLSKEFFGLIVLALALAVPLSWVGMESWLNSFTSRIGITTIPFLVAGFATILLMLMIIGFHVIKLSHENPSDALRKE